MVVIGWVGGSGLGVSAKPRCSAKTTSLDSHSLDVGPHRPDVLPRSRRLADAHARAPVGAGGQLLGVLHLDDGVGALGDGGAWVAGVYVMGYVMGVYHVCAIAWMLPSAPMEPWSRPPTRPPVVM